MPRTIIFPPFPRIDLVLSVSKRHFFEVSGFVPLRAHSGPLFSPVFPLTLVTPKGTFFSRWPGNFFTPLPRPSSEIPGLATRDQTFLSRTDRLSSQSFVRDRADAPSRTTFFFSIRRPLLILLRFDPFPGPRSLLGLGSSSSPGSLLREFLITFPPDTRYSRLGHRFQCSFLYPVLAGRWIGFLSTAPLLLESVHLLLQFFTAYLSLLASRLKPSSTIPFPPPLKLRLDSYNVFLRHPYDVFDPPGTDSFL